MQQGASKQASCLYYTRCLLLVLLGSNPLPKLLQDDMVMLNIFLKCEQTKSSVMKEVHFKSLPTTPLEIKKKIEEDFSIPSCVQTLHYQSMILKDSDQLQLTHFRSGDTFTVDYPIEAECEMIKNVIKWLKELHKLLKSIEENISSSVEESDLLLSSNIREVENLIIEGEKDDTIEALSYALFYTQNKKRKVNQFYFHQEGGLDVLMKVYGILISKEWGDLGIDKRYHIYLEGKCSQGVSNCQLTRLQIVDSGIFEINITTLLRRQLKGGDVILDPLIHATMRNALFVLSP